MTLYLCTILMKFLIISKFSDLSLFAAHNFLLSPRQTTRRTNLKLLQLYDQANCFLHSIVFKNYYHKIKFFRRSFLYILQVELHFVFILFRILNCFNKIWKWNPSGFPKGKILIKEFASVS